MEHIEGRNRESYQFKYSWRQLILLNRPSDYTKVVKRGGIVTLTAERGGPKC